MCVVYFDVFEIFPFDGKFCWHFFLLSLDNTILDYLRFTFSWIPFKWLYFFFEFLMSFPSCLNYLVAETFVSFFFFSSLENVTKKKLFLFPVASVSCTYNFFVYELWVFNKCFDFRPFFNWKIWDSVEKKCVFLSNRLLINFPFTQNNKNCKRGN